MSDNRITRGRIDELLRFLPQLRRRGRSFCRASEQEFTDDGALIMVHPIYDDDVLQFFSAAGRSWWSDYSYANNPVRRRLDDEEFINHASLDEIRTLLTACVRGERFCDGFWEHVLRSGAVFHILERLRELRSAIA